MTDFNFSSLSPETIIDGLESAGFQVDSGLLALNSYENRVYQFHDEERRKFVCKFYRPGRWQLQQIQEEHDFSFQLDEQELPIVAPLKRDGISIFHHNGFHFAVFPCRGGRIFEVDNLEQLEWMGRFVGRIHAVSSQQDFKHRPTVSIQESLLDARQVLQDCQMLPLGLQTPFYTILDQVIELASARYAPNRQIRLHGDCHAGNILWTDDGPHFVDLDDCKTGPAIQDLWMMLSGDRQQQMLQMDTLLMGYEEFFSFDSSELSLIESLRTMRVVHYMAWLARRWQDPAFPRNFPWFNTEKYWEQQILALKEQVATLQEPPLSLMP